MSSEPMFTPAALRQFAVRDETYRRLAREDPERHPPERRTWQDWEELRRREHAADPERLTDEEVEVVWKAMQLAPGTREGLAVCEALLRGEDVPIQSLDPDAVRRYGLR